MASRRLTFKRLPFTSHLVFWILIVILLNVILQNVVSPSIFLIDLFHHSSRIIHQPDFPICFSVSSLSRIGEEPIAVKMEHTLHQLKPVAKNANPSQLKLNMKNFFILVPAGVVGLKPLNPYLGMMRQVFYQGSLTEGEGSVWLTYNY